MDVGPAYERGGARGGRSPTGLRRIPATLVVAEQHSLSPESNPSRAPIRRPVAASTLAPAAARPPQDPRRGGWPPLWAPEDTCPHATDDLFETGDVSGRGLPAGHQPLRLKTSGPMKAFSHPHSCRESQFSSDLRGAPPVLGRCLPGVRLGAPGSGWGGDSDSEVWRLCHRGGSKHSTLRL